MREILFRGKRLCLDEWVEGYFSMAKMHRFAEELYEYISVPHPKVEGMPSDNFLVDPDTVGQFTGLTDKNGKKIFEGDIVHILGNQDVEDWKNVDYTALIAFIDGGFCAIDGTVEEHGFRRYALARLDFSLEVIGNIHDNPELLGGE